MRASRPAEGGTSTLEDLVGMPMGRLIDTIAGLVDKNVEKRDSPQR
jgi:hypothetical protein